MYKEIEIDRERGGRGELRKNQIELEELATSNYRGRLRILI